MSATGRKRAKGPQHVRPKNDFFETPWWTTRAILHELGKAPGHGGEGFRVHDPACGRGAIMVQVRRMWPGANVSGADIDQAMVDATQIRNLYAWQRDYLDPLKERDRAELIIANPPYSLADAFVRRALVDVDEGGQVAMLLRLGWLGGQERAAFHREYPSDVYISPRRPSYTGDGNTDATEAAWFVWGPGRGNTWKLLDV